MGYCRAQSRRLRCTVVLVLFVRDVNGVTWVVITVGNYADVDMDGGVHKTTRIVPLQLVYRSEVTLLV